MATVKIEKRKPPKVGKTHVVAGFHIRKAKGPDGRPRAVARIEHERVDPEADYMPDHEVPLASHAEAMKVARDHVGQIFGKPPATGQDSAMADESSNTAGGEQFASAPPITPNPE